jgi:hypothetical protein
MEPDPQGWGRKREAALEFVRPEQVKQPVHHGAASVAAVCPGAEGAGDYGAEAAGGASLASVEDFSVASVL